MNVKTMLGSLFERADPFIDATATGTGAALLWQLLRSRRTGNVAGPVGTTAPRSQNANPLGLGKADEARITHATFGGGLTKEELTSLMQLFAGLEPHQQKSLRVSITAFEGGQTPKKDGVASSDVLTLKGLAMSAREIGIDETRKLLLSQGVITISTPTQDAKNAVYKLAGLTPGREYTAEEFDEAFALQLARMDTNPPKPLTESHHVESVGYIGYWIGKATGTKNIKP